MAQPAPFFDLVRQSLEDPVSAGHRLIALRPPMLIRWMLLAATVASSVALLYLPAGLSGQLALMPSPVSFAAIQAAANILLAALVARVGQAFGGTGRFADALWLVGWMQAITTLMLVVQIVAVLVLPGLNMPVAMLSIGVSLWVLVGFILALHGFVSRVMVLVGIVGVFILLSVVLSIVLVMLGFDPSGVSNV